MGIVPEEYREKMLAENEPKMAEWLNGLEQKIEKCRKKFRLEQIEVIPELGENFIISAYSNKYKRAVMLKLANPTLNLEREAYMLKLYGNKEACKYIYLDLEERVMVLEKILPGSSLKEVDSRKQRVKQFVELLKRLKREITDDKITNSYESSITKEFSCAMDKKEEYGKTGDLVPLAWSYYQEIQQLGQKKYLLHGDLHHGNILWDGTKWRVIDPQGMIAEEMVEIVKFARTEIQQVGNTRNHIEETVTEISNQMNLSRAMVAKITFIELIRSNCWKTRIHRNKKEIEKNIQIAKEVLAYYQE